MHDLLEERGTVLVVDDSPEIVEMLQALLEDHYDVRVAGDGGQALELVLREPKPDAVLLDVVMPGINGYEVLGRLKADPATADIPVIFITSRSEPQESELGFELGCADYITKPFLPAVILARVRTHVTLRRALDFIGKSAGRRLA